MGAAVPIRGSRFLIVGGASLVGSATAQLLLEEGAAEVKILDSFYQGSREAIRHIEHDPRLKVVEGDVLRLPHVLAATKGMDGVLHLAAVMSLTMDRDPWMGLNVNISGTQNVIEACCANGVKKLVFPSSTAAYGYGPGIVGDLVETTPFHSAGAPPAAILYGCTKIIGEQLCRDAHAKRGLDYVALRYATVYGERQHYRAANALYIIETYDRVKKGQPPQVIGDGSETKHFVHVADVARANAAAFASAATDVAVNISGPKPVTTLELVRLVTELAGKELAPEHIEPAAGKVRLTSGGPWRLDHGAAGRLIGWRPEVDMREGIRRLIAWRES
jgi:UDP-glucose 4-epimerase